MTETTITSKAAPVVFDGVSEDDGTPNEVAKVTYVGVRMEYTPTGACGQVFAVQDDVDDPLELGTSIKMSFVQRGPVLMPKG